MQYQKGILQLTPVHYWKMHVSTRLTNMVQKQGMMILNLEVFSS